MRTAFFLVVFGAGVAIAMIGDDPSPIAAVLAVLAFPLAAAAADAPSRTERRRPRTPLGAALVTALSGGVLVGLLLRLAFAAPDWLSASSADCGGASTGVQQLVLWGATLVFLLALAPVGATLVGIGNRLAEGRRELFAKVPLSMYPLAVAACGIALIGAGFVTNCT